MTMLWFYCSYFLHILCIIKHTILLLLSPYSCRCEIPLTGCRYDLKSNTEPWVCPTNRTGFLQSTPKSTWGKFMQTKVRR